MESRINGRIVDTRAEYGYGWHAVLEAQAVGGGVNAVSQAGHEREAGAHDRREYLAHALLSINIGSAAADHGQQLGGV